MMIANCKLFRATFASLNYQFAVRNLQFAILLRMKIPRRSSKELGIDMTPMIDVVFQLIIFFLVSSHLVKQETQVKLPLPVASSGDKDKDTEKPRLTVNVLAGGELQLAGRRLSKEELASRLAEKVAELGKDVEVRIRSSRDVPYAKVEPVMLACARAGVWNVTFAVYRPEDAR
jgi:biopolymer transport protein ExbD